MTAWSYSSLNDFQNCPRAYQLKRVTKECKTVESEAMRFGTECHAYLENRMVKKDALPPHLEWLEAMMRMVEESSGEVVSEQQVAITKGLTPTTWFGKDVWCRGVFDGGIRHKDRSIIYDYKTGKRKHDTEQLMLFAGLEFALRPEIAAVKTGYVWLKDKVIDSAMYTREDIPSIWNHFLPKVERLEKAFATNEWPAKSSGLCGWCPATKLQCKNAKG